MFAAILTAVMVVTSTAQAQAPASPRLAWPSLATEVGGAKVKSDDVAVVVGISDYLVLPDIDGAADNARDWAQYLTRVAGLRGDHITLLTDAEATKERIERALQQASQQASASSKHKGRLWFIFIGHGAPSPKGDDGLLLGADAQADADSLAARGLAQKVVEGIVDAGAHADAVIVYDACFSGSTADGEKPLVRGLQATLPVRKAPPPAAKAKVILASSESFAGPLPGEKRPAYSYLLLGALRGWADDNRDGRVDVDKAHGFASGVMRQTLKATNRLPQRRGTQGAVVLAARAAEEKPDVMALVMQRCPDGTRWGGRSCAVVDCPKGTQFNGVSCAATAASVQCPAGTTWNGSACVASGVSCPQGTTWNGSACTATAVGCPQGASWDGSRCVATVASVTPTPAPTPAPTPTAWPTTTMPLPPTNVWGAADAFGDDDDDDDGFVGDEAAAMLLASMAESGEAVLLADRLILNTDRLFQSGKDTITTSALPVVRAVAMELRDMGVTGLMVVCHTDSTGNDNFNQQLSMKRARALAGAMQQTAGVHPSAVAAQGAGEVMPIADNATAAGRKANRRCEIAAQ